MPADSTSHDEALARTRIMLRPLGSAMPLGFFAFGTGALMTAILDLQWVAKAEYKHAAIALLTFVAPLELLSCIFSFLSPDAAGATSMGIFAASWGVFATFWLTTGPEQSPILGVFTVMITGAILCMGGAALRSKPLLGFLLLLAALRDGFLAAFHLGDKPALKVVGWCGLVLAAFAVYCGLAFLVEDVNQRTLLPLGRREKARQSLEGSLADQLERIEQEAGIRNQL